MNGETLFLVIFVVIACECNGNLPKLPLTTRLYGNIHSTAYHLADVAIGFPLPQRQSLIVDTGSSVTAFGCQDCMICGKHHIDGLFDRTKSSTAQQVHCGTGSDENCNYCNVHEDQAHCSYMIRYLEGSHLEGLWYKDVFWLGHRQCESPLHCPNSASGFPAYIPFGCHMQETHLFIDQLASGIMGLEPRSHFGPNSFIQASIAALSSTVTGNNNSTTTTATRKVPLEGFALCFSNNGGSLAIGAPHTEFHRHTGSIARPGPSGPKHTSERRQTFSPKGLKNSEEVGSSGFRQTTSFWPVTAFNRLLQSWFAGGRFRSSRWPATADTHSVEKFAEEDKAYKYSLTDANKRQSTRMQFQGPPERKGAEEKPSELLSRPSERQKGSKERPMSSEWDGVQWVEVTKRESYTVEIAELRIGANTFALHHSLSKNRGMQALVDSGTTLSYLPFVLYVEILMNIEQSVDGEFLDKESKELHPISGSEEERIVSTDKSENLDLRLNSSLDNNLSAEMFNEMVSMEHISGVSLLELRQQVSSYLHNVTEDILESKNDEDVYNLNNRNLNGGDYGRRAALRSVGKSAEQLLRKLNDLEESGGGRRSLMVGKSQHWSEFMKKNPSASHRTTKAVKLDYYTQEECWHLPRGNENLKNFPIIYLTFAGGSEYRWEPSAYLYQKGTSTIRCLAIAPRGYEANAKQSSGNNSNYRAASHSSNSSNYQSVDVLGLDGVLGSNFFMGHDIIFDLQGQLFSGGEETDEYNFGRIGFVKADCPVYDLASDRKQFHPLSQYRYLDKLMLTSGKY